MLRRLGVRVGQVVRVTARDGRFVDVRILPGGCACGIRDGKPTLLDLTVAAFAKLDDPSVGYIDVRVSW